MLFRRTPQSEGNSDQPGVRPAFQIFLEIQKRQDPPVAVILQPDHSRLAGEIARRLRSEVFGDLPEEVIEAIAEHDSGWREIDETQIANIAAQPLRPFPLLSAEESLPAWRASVRKARDSSPLKGVIISRHFCALSETDAAHRPFAEEETPRREQVERTLNIPSQDLDRWTAAIGFCDLVSLYLCSGAREPAEFPLAHPALPDSRNARKVLLEWTDGQPRFTSALMQAGSAVFVNAQAPDREWANPHAITVSWNFR